MIDGGGGGDGSVGGNGGKFIITLCTRVLSTEIFKGEKLNQRSFDR